MLQRQWSETRMSQRLQHSVRSTVLSIYVTVMGVASAALEQAAAADRALAAIETVMCSESWRSTLSNDVDLIPSWYFAVCSGNYDIIGWWWWWWWRCCWCGCYRVAAERWWRHAFNRLATPANTLTTAVISLPLTTQTIVTHCRMVRLTASFREVLSSQSRTRPHASCPHHQRQAMWPHGACAASVALTSCPTTDGVQSCGYVTLGSVLELNLLTIALVRSIA